MKKIIFGTCFLLSVFFLSAKTLQTNATKTPVKAAVTPSTKKAPAKKSTQKIKKVPSNKHNKRKKIPKKV
ncbi:MAG: hypothetical protein ABI199_06910 [Bacteroidia bacterium]